MRRRRERSARDAEPPSRRFPTYHRPTPQPRWRATVVTRRAGGTRVGSREPGISAPHLPPDPGQRRAARSAGRGRWSTGGVSENDPSSWSAGSSVGSVDAIRTSSQAPGPLTPRLGRLRRSRLRTMTVLEGIRVVELGAWVAGPGAGGLLADWGADVIKVEAPEGDPMRRLFAVLAGHGEPQSPPFDLDNRGKRSVVLDLRSEEGRADDARARSPPPTCSSPTCVRMPSSGSASGPRRCSAAHDRLVYAQVSGFGRTGPDAAPRRLRPRARSSPARAWPARLCRPDQPPVANAGGRRRPHHRHHHHRRHLRRAVRTGAHRAGPAGRHLAAAGRDLHDGVAAPDPAALRQAPAHRSPHRPSGTRSSTPTRPATAAGSGCSASRPSATGRRCCRRSTVPTSPTTSGSPRPRTAASTPRR